LQRSQDRSTRTRRTSASAWSKGWCIGGTTRPEVKRGSRKARPAAAAPTPAAEAAPAAEPKDEAEE